MKNFNEFINEDMQGLMDFMDVFMAGGIDQKADEIAQKINDSYIEMLKADPLLADIIDDEYVEPSIKWIHVGDGKSNMKSIHIKFPIEENTTLDEWIKIFDHFKKKLPSHKEVFMDTSNAGDGQLGSTVYIKIYPEDFKTDNIIKSIISIDKYNL